MKMQCQRLCSPVCATWAVMPRSSERRRVTASDAVAVACKSLARKRPKGSEQVGGEYRTAGFAPRAPAHQSKEGAAYTSVESVYDQLSRDWRLPVLRPNSSTSSSVLLLAASRLVKGNIHTKSSQTKQKARHRMLHVASKQWVLPPCLCPLPVEGHCCCCVLLLLQVHS